MARQVLENGVILPAEYSDDWYDDMTSNLTKLDDVIGSDSEKLSSADVGAAALSNNYNDLDNLPTIPTVNDATLTIQKNGVDVQTFTANASSNVTCNITVPTKTSDLTNDSNFVDTSNPAVASGITSAKVTSYDSHITDTDIHVTTADKAKWNTVTSKANDSDVMHLSGNETKSGLLTFRGSYLGNEPSASFRTDFQLLSRYDTEGKSGLLISKFRSNKAQGQLSGSDSVFLNLDLLENEVRTNGYLRFNFSSFANGLPQTFSLIPKADITTNLGTSTAKWTKINGINPGSLSLPDLANGIDISSYITIGDTDNNYTPSVDGWIWIRLIGNGASILQGDFGINSSYVTNTSVGEKWVETNLFVTKDVQATIRCRGITGIVGAKFYPCQGNV